MRTSRRERTSPRPGRASPTATRRQRCRVRGTLRRCIRGGATIPRTTRPARSGETPTSDDGVRPLVGRRPNGRRVRSPSSRATPRVLPDDPGAELPPADSGERGLRVSRPVVDTAFGRIGFTGMASSPSAGAGVWSDVSTSRGTNEATGATLTWDARKSYTAAPLFPIAPILIADTVLLLPNKSTCGQRAEDAVGCLPALRRRDRRSAPAGQRHRRGHGPVRREGLGQLLGLWRAVPRSLSNPDRR